ncbi:hypothetical protein GGS24DRAFT_507217 [Hypoxylon argillaceum]|nr:hypothetical protein GGS24DRAFT_507217 [Hypoxylon argillaceum]
MSGTHNNMENRPPYGKRQRPKLSINTQIPLQSGTQSQKPKTVDSEVNEEFSGSTITPPSSQPKGSKQNSLSVQGTSKGPAKKVVQGLARLGKKVVKRINSGFTKANASQPPANSIQLPQYALARNMVGDIPLLTLERQRNLDLSQTSQGVSLIYARSALQDFRATFTRDLPELNFPRGQAQINIVAEYLMNPCPSDLESSPTTQFVRHSHDSLRAWKAYSEMNQLQNPRAYRRWNMIEARRRVRHHNSVIQDFNDSWDTWVGEQDPEIQSTARRHPEREDQGYPGKPFRDFYHSSLIACDEEIQQRQDIAEALILQYPNSFPGFMKKPDETVS